MTKVNHLSGLFYKPLAGPRVNQAEIAHFILEIYSLVLGLLYKDSFFGRFERCSAANFSRCFRLERCLGGRKLSLGTDGL